MCDDYEEPGIFWGWGTAHDLSDHPEERPRLLGMRSVSDGAAWALHKQGRKPVRAPRMGFRLPKRRK